MATILDMLENRLPDEAVLFAGSLGSFIEEAGALAGLDGVAEEDMTVLQKSLVADMAAKALILPAMSHYKKALAKAEGDGAGSAEWTDTLAFLVKMESKLETDIADKKSLISAGTDTGVPLKEV
ncbi:MAG: hypothetical protein MI799_24550 [Desulfobacterales bacterium]|nr:hypothetical protein [Desulfobacterales bacterium]